MKDKGDRIMGKANIKQDTRMTFEEMLSKAHGLAVDKGFWDKGANRNKGEMIALIHAELSEMLEAVRLPGIVKSEKIPYYTAEAEELADVIIRALDYAGGWGIDVQGAIEAKLKYNETRPVKHGKSF